MDDPSVLLCVPIDHLKQEHCQQELPFDGFEQLQKLLHVPLVERISVVAAVGVHVGRIDEMKGIRCFVAGDHIEGIAVLDGHVLQLPAEILRKLVINEVTI